MLKEVSRFVWDLLDFRPDAVHLNTSGGLAFARDAVMLQVAAMFHIPVTYHLRFGRLPEVAAKRSWEWMCAKVALRRARIVVSLDERTASVVRDLRLPSPVFVLPNPIADETLLADPMDGYRRNIALFVGWVVPSKGIDELLSAWAKISAPGWELQIVGPGDPDYVRELRSRLLADSVSLVGPLGNAEVLQRMRESRIFIFPSHTEGFPNAVAEAMASQLSIVATDVGAIRSMLRSGAGLTVAPGDAEALAAAIQVAVDSPTTREQMAARARERACKEFGMESVFARYVALWRESSFRHERRPC